MKPWLLMAGVLMAAAGALGLAVAASGIIPVAASSGHFAITERLLIFAKQRSVATHTLGEPSPLLGEPSAVLKGAGHFESACRPCHGAPDLERQPRVARSMLPPPPSLSERAPEWQPRELFYIVKHGIKMTGMPSWPSQVRDDEVAAMVAFLAVLPGLDADGYRRLVHGAAREGSERAPGAGREGTSDGATPGAALGEDGARPSGEPLGALVGGAHPPRSIVETCGRCHGLDGRGRGNAAFPSLAGQSESYLRAALEAYATDRRQSGMMQPLAAALDPDEWREVVEYYGRLPRRAAHAAAAGEDAAAVERGRTIAERGAPERRVPSCSDCHGPGPGPREPDMPRLAGQYAEYLVLQLELFAAGHRGGGPRAHLMDAVAPRMSREQMRDVAAYYASLR